MKFNLFAAWTSYILVLVAAFCLGAFLVAAGSGFGGWALIAGLAGLGVLGALAGLFAGTVHHDRKVHRASPHLFTSR